MTTRVQGLAGRSPRARSPVARREDHALLRGTARFASDLDLPELEDCAHVTFVRSPLPHGVIVDVDTSAARCAPGVLGVYTAGDLGRADLRPPHGAFPPVVTQPPLARERVRFVGEALAAVVSEDAATGADAAERVTVDIAPLPPAWPPSLAARDESLVFPALGTNTVWTSGAPPDPTHLAEADAVVRATIVIPRLAPCPLEPRAGAAAWDDGGRLTQWMATQRPHAARDAIAEFLGVPPTSVRVVTPQVGGGFGARANPYPEELLLGLLARFVGRPLRWSEARSETTLGLQHGRAQVQEVALAGSRTGRMETYHLQVLQDQGAYLRPGPVLPQRTGTMASGCYTLGRIEYSARSVVTNAVPVGPYRGAGRPEAILAVERAVDLLAHELGMDPVDVRRANLVDGRDFPFTTATGAVYDTGAYHEVLARALDVVGYDRVRAEQRRRRAEGACVLLGVGVASYVEVTASGPLVGEHATVTLEPDGSATVRTGACPSGQGHETTWAMIAADALGVPVESVRVFWGDTDQVARGVGSVGSRSVQLGGGAIRRAAEGVVEQGRALAADVLEAALDDVVFDPRRGGFHVSGAPAILLDWPAVVATTDDALLFAEADYRAEATFPFGAHVAVVEVDRETGKAVLVRFVAVDDAGTIVHPLLAEGQVHGGIAQGVGQALYEEFALDADATPRSVTMADYLVPSAAELPNFETVLNHTPTPNNVLGAKGIGESGAVGAAAAVLNAVVDAVAHLGVRHIDPPATPEKVWRAIRATDRDAIKEEPRWT